VNNRESAPLFVVVFVALFAAAVGLMLPVAISSPSLYRNQQAIAPSLIAGLCLAAFHSTRTKKEADSMSDDARGYRD
jgi:hypothetical protein